MNNRTLTHLERLEAESIHIMREVVAEAEKPVMLYSVGKDSAVMLHLARKAFYPSPPPFPLLHVDTTWKFRAMYELREKAAHRGADQRADAPCRRGHRGAPTPERARQHGIDHGKTQAAEQTAGEALQEAADQQNFHRGRGRGE